MRLAAAPLSTRLACAALALAACGPATEPVTEPEARHAVHLVLFAAAELPLAGELRAGLGAQGLAHVERDPDEGLFVRAFGTPGRLGLAWVDQDDEVLSALPGYTAAQEVVRRDRLVRQRAEDWHASGPTRRARLQLALRAEAAAEARLRGLLARGEEGPLLTLLARALVRRGAVAEALAACERAEALGEASDDLRLTRALARIASREPGRALALLEGLEGEEARLARGLALHHLDDEGALEELRVVLDRYPLGPWCADARREIEHILQPPEEHTH